MKNIHILPTDKPSRLFKVSGELKLTRNFDFYNGLEYQNIYITSDSEIKVGDWYLNSVIPTNERINKSRGTNVASFYKSKDVRKIILTTDQDLIADGVQAIDDEFLEWFVRNPSCEEVEVQKWFDGLDFLEYKIIIPQEEPKQECTCGVCDNCEEQETIQILKEAKENALKQETITDFIKRESKSANESVGIVKGANWQAERMYSEEDFKLFARQYYREIRLNKSNLLWDDLADKCLEQFKKK